MKGHANGSVWFWATPKRITQFSRLIHAPLDYIVNLSDHSELYLDDSSPERQKAIMTVIDVMRAEFERCDNVK